MPEGLNEEIGAAPEDLPTPSARSLLAAFLSIPVNLTRRLFDLAARLHRAVEGADRSRPVEV